MSKISLDPKTEKALVRKSQRNKKAFTPLYKHYAPFIKRYFSQRGGGDDLEDLISKVFEKALLGIDDFQWQGVPFSAWLFRIAHNCLVDYYREQAIKREKSTLLDEKTASREKTPEEKFVQGEEERELRQLLAELPPRERGIIYMKFFEGYTNRTIARLLNLSETNIGTIIYRTVRKLRRRLLAQTKTFEEKRLFTPPSQS